MWINHDRESRVIHLNLTDYSLTGHELEKNTQMGSIQAKFTCSLLVKQAF